MKAFKSMPGVISLSLLLTLFCVQQGCSQDEKTPQIKGDGETEKAEKESHHAVREGGPNLLAGETSPYLLAHANNPVDWFPWGEAALTKAKKENKPIFLSIGYSSCHWCHVMEHESFMDPEIAKLMNENFVCVKVDREERPDIDHIYMTALHTYNRLSGSGAGGGWPLSMFLTPDARPFFGGTYFPARDGDRGTRMGFISILKNVDRIWTEQPKKLLADAEVITENTRLELSGSKPDQLVDIQPTWVTSAQSRLKSTFDEQFGGFTNLRSPERPKFPEPSNLFFLIHLLKKNRANEEAKTMLTVTLDRMAMGGIRDHVGNGFHRYSVDRYWHIPHFEKMLYDNGQLATVYAEAGALLNRDDYLRTAEQICVFVINELTSPHGAWYSALDADSEGEEGKFYRWTREELQEILNEEDYQLFAKVYGVDKQPNFEGEWYAPQFDRSFIQIARELGKDPDALREQLTPLRKKLFDARSKRVRPLTDTKILTSWNGLMIRGMADTGRILEREDFIKAAQEAADFILTKMKTEDGRLYRTFAGNETNEPTAKLNAYLNDYAFLIDGLLALHAAAAETEADAKSDSKWLTAAIELQKKQDELFWDETAYGYFFTSVDHEVLLARAKDPVDGAQPAGNSVSAVNLLRLSEVVADKTLADTYRERAEQTVRGVSPLLTRAPSAAPRLLIAVDKLTTE